MLELVTSDENVREALRITDINTAGQPLQSWDVIKKDTGLSQQQRLEKLEF